VRVAQVPDRGCVGPPTSRSSRKTGNIARILECLPTTRAVFLMFLYLGNTPSRRLLQWNASNSGAEAFRRIPY